MAIAFLPAVQYRVSILELESVITFAGLGATTLRVTAPPAHV